VDAEKDT